MSYRNNNAEGGIENSSVNSGQTGSGSPFDTLSVSSTNNTALMTYSTFTKMHGTQSYRVTTSTANDQVYVIYTAGTSNANAAVRFYICVNYFAASAIRIVTVRPSSGGIGINVNGTNRLQIVDASGSGVFTMNNPLSVGTWYRVELKVSVGTSTTGSATFACYVGDSLSPIEPLFSTTTANFGTTNLTYALFGKVTATTAVTDFSLDDIAFDIGGTNFIGPIPSIEILQDPFTSQGVSSSRWIVQPGDGTIDQSNQKLTFTLASDNGSYTYDYIESSRTYNLTNSKVFVECVDFVNPVQGAEQQFIVQLDDDHAITIMFDGNYLGCGYTLPGGAGSTNYEIRDTVQHRWLQIRETNGTIYWETSPDQVQWTTHNSITTPFDVSFIKVRLRAGTWQSVSNPGIASFDNLNIGVTASLSWLHM